MDLNKYKWGLKYVYYLCHYVAEVSNGFMLSLVPLSNNVHGIPIGYRLFEASKEYLNKYKASFCLYIKYWRDKVIM